MTLSYIPSDTNDEGILKATASGTLPSGQPVIVNADGTVSVVAGVAQVVGTAVVYEAATSSFNSTTFDSNSNKVIIAYQDAGNSSYGTAIVGTVSGESISFGSPVVFESANSQYISVTFDSSSNKVVIAYYDGANSGGYGTAIVGTVSGSSISFGSAVVFASHVTTWTSTTFDSDSNKVVIAYRNHSNGYGTAIVGTVSGSSISFGSAVVYESASTFYTSANFDSNLNKVIIAYQDAGNSSYGTAIVGTVSGSSISFGSPVVFEGASTSYISVTFDSNTNKVVLVYTDTANSNIGTAIVGTVSGSTISFGSPVAFFEARYVSATFDSNINKVVIAYGGTAPADYGTVIVGTVSGSTISFDSPAVFSEADTIYVGSVFDSNSNRTVIAYRNKGNSSYGTSLVFKAGFTTLTAENYIGMSSGVVIDNSVPQAVSSPTVYDGSSNYHSATFDSNSNKVVIAYVDVGNSSYGTAIIGTVSGNSISFGTPVVFESASSNHTSIVFDSNSNKVVVAYTDVGNSSYGTAIVGTVSGTGISFGSPAVFESASSTHISAAFDSNSNKIVIAYMDAGNSSYGTAIVGTVSGSSISFGTAAVFNSSLSTYNNASFDSTANKVVICCRDNGNSSLGKALVATVSGTSISFGTVVVFNNAATAFLSSTYDSNANKTVIVYQNIDSSKAGTAIAGTVSGTSISFGTPVVFNSDDTSYNSISFDSTANKVVIAYRDAGNSSYGTAIAGTVSGTSISFDSPIVFEQAYTLFIGSAFDSNSNKTVIAYRDNDNSSYGTAVVFQVGTTDVTRGQVPSGTQATTNIIGSVSSNQSSLTAGQSYFVQTDGTIGLTAASPSVFAGTAISATKLIVKT